MKVQLWKIKIFSLGEFGDIYFTTLTESTNHVLEMIIRRESPYNSEKVIKMCLEVNHDTTILIGSFGNICFKDSDTDQLANIAVGRDPWITSAQ